MSIIITGANGYVGKSICEFLYNKGIHFKTVTRGNIRHHFHYGNNVSCDFQNHLIWLKSLMDIIILFTLHHVSIIEETFQQMNIEL